MEQSALYSQQGGKILAYRKQDGTFVKIDGTKNIPPDVDLNLPVQQLPAHAFQAQSTPVSFGDSGTMTKDANTFQSARGKLESGKIYVPMGGAGATDPVGVPMTYYNGQLIPMQGFTKQDVDVILQDSPQGQSARDKVRTFMQDNPDIIKSNPDLAGDLHLYNTMTVGRNEAQRVWDQSWDTPVSSEQVKNQNIQTQTLDRALQAGTKGQDFITNVEQAGGDLFNRLKPVPTGETPTVETEGYTPGYKGIYRGKEDLILNTSAVNHLFKQYHNRDANQQELNYWSDKKVGDLEDTLAKTTIFSGEEADKIREQMMSQGKTYISNHAELEQLAQTGGIDPQTVTKQGSMLFRPEPDESVPATPTAPTEPTSPAAPAAPAAPAEPTVSDTGSSIIDQSNIPDDLKALYKKVVDMYPEGVEANPEEILKTFNKLRNETIDPYFRELIRGQEDQFRRGYESLIEERAMEIEQERYGAGEGIRQARTGLEKSGMTFTGKAIEELGAESAYARPGEGVVPVEGGVPEQIPFGGLFYEGKVPRVNRLVATSNQARYQRQLEELGRSAESQLGTSGLPFAPAGYAPLGGVEGSIERNRQSQYGQTLNQVMSNYATKQDLNRNIQIPSVF